jgi:hypothetical protein
LQGGSGILVHRFDEIDNRSYVMGPPASEELAAPFGAHPQKIGEVFQVGDEKHTFEDVYRCEVIAINDAAHTATVRLRYRPAAPIPLPHQWPPLWPPLTGPIESDAGGIYILGGKVHRLPPYGPVVQIMQQVTAHTEAVSIQDAGIRTLTQASALTSIIGHAAKALRALDPIRTPAPAPTRSQTQTKTATAKSTKPSSKTKPK